MQSNPIVCGGFNFPGINWKHNCVSVNSNMKKLHDNFLSILTNHNLNQMVIEPTWEENIFDPMLTNNPSIITSLHILLGFSTHQFVLSDSNLSISKFSVTYFNTMCELYINIKWNALKKHLNGIMTAYITSKITTKRHNRVLHSWVRTTI